MRYPDLFYLNGPGIKRGLQKSCNYFTCIQNAHQNRVMTYFTLVFSDVQTLEAAGPGGVPTDRTGLLSKPQGNGECFTICSDPITPFSVHADACLKANQSLNRHTLM